MKQSRESLGASVRLKNNRRDISRIRRAVLPILRQHHVRRAALFGSFARGEGTRHSDLDILIQFAGNKSLLDLVALKIDLESKTGRKVDVLTYRSLHPAIRERILKEQIALL